MWRQFVKTVDFGSEVKKLKALRLPPERLGCRAAPTEAAKGAGNETSEYSDGVLVDLARVCEASLAYVIST
jgi:hypothetical protein